MNITDTQKEDIYRNYHSKVWGYIRSRITNTQNAEDLMSDVFVKIYEKIDSYDETQASLSTWIYTITRNTLTDYYRTHRTFDEIPESQDDGFSVEEAICSEEMLETLAKALKTLDERERDIIVLRFYSGKTLKEIAAQMGISYAYVKVLQNRALAELKKIIAGQ